MIPKIIHIITKDLNKNQQNVLNNNKKVLGNSYKFIIYNDTNDLDNIIINNFNELKEMYFSIKIKIIKIDIVRWLILYLYGGIYIDSDYCFIKQIPEELFNNELVIPQEITEDDIRLGNAIMFSEKGNQFAYDIAIFLLNKCKDLPKLVTESEIINIYSGPGAVTKFYIKYKDKYNVITPEFIEYLSPPHCINNKLRTCYINNSTIGVHLCFGSWRFEKGNKSYGNTCNYINLRNIETNRIILYKI